MKRLILPVLLMVLMVPQGANAQAADARTADTDQPVASLLTAPTRTDLAVPSRAVLMSPVFTGWGQLYADNGWRAVLAFSLEAYYLSHVLMNDRKARRLQAFNQNTSGSLNDTYNDQVIEYWELMRDSAWRSIGALFFITVDAYVGAHLHRFDVDATPVPQNWEPGEIPQPIELPTAVEPEGIVLMSLGGRF